MDVEEEGIEAKFAGATVFSCLDFIDSFHQPPLDEKSKYIYSFLLRGSAL